MFDARRRWLRALAATSGALWLPSLAPAASAPLQTQPRFSRDPFSLGVASGYPTATGVVLWTRLAPVPDAPGGGMNPETVPVRWSVATDERFSDIVASGTAWAEPDYAHAVHVEVTGLAANRRYWYRFTSGDASSPVGRTRTTPPASGAASRAQRLRFVFASCQQFEQGYYGAWSHAVRDDPDLAVFLGDYIYEASWGSNHVRKHNAPEPVTLDDYRARYALYKSDPDLQAAHAAMPWLVIWDDHEVQNDYANDRSQAADDPAWFLARRAAAYRAYYEHMPLPRRMHPLGPNMRIHTRFAFGDLANFHLLDDRQYRTQQACPHPGRGGSNVVDVAECAALLEPGRSLLGAGQLEWLEAGLSTSRSRWNVIAQQTLMAQLDQKPGPGRGAWTDGWDGYPAERRRILEHIASRDVNNPVVIGGDVHVFHVADLKPDFDDPTSPVVATEFVTAGITSQAPSQASRDRLRADNPHIKLADSRHRGYARVELTRERLTVDLRGMDSVATRDAPCRTLSTWAVENGKPGARAA